MFVQLCPCPWNALAVPVLSLVVSVLSLVVPSCPSLSLFCPWLHFFFPSVIVTGQNDLVVALCSLSLIMVEVGAKLQIPEIKGGLVLINMSPMT